MHRLPCDGTRSNIAEESQMVFNIKRRTYHSSRGILVLVSFTENILSRNFHFNLDQRILNIDSSRAFYSAFKFKLIYIKKYKITNTYIIFFHVRNKIKLSFDSLFLEISWHLSASQQDPERGANRCKQRISQKFYCQTLSKNEFNQSRKLCFEQTVSEKHPMFQNKKLSKM